MDLKKFDSITSAEKGVELVLEEKTKEGEGAAIMLYGADSSKCREKDRDIQRRNAEKHAPLTPEEVDAQMFERLVNATKGWRGLLEDGKELVFSPAAAEKLYRAYPEITDRVTRFVFTRANFFTTASGS